MIKKLIQSSVVYGGLYALSKLMTVLLLPFLTNNLTASEFGRLDNWLVISTYLVLIVTVALDSSLQRYYYDQSVQDGTLVSNIISTILAISTFLFPLLTLVVYYITKEYVMELMLVFLWTVSNSILTILLINVRYLDKKLEFSALSLASPLIGMSLAYIFIKYQKLDVIGYFLGLAIGTLIVSAYLVKRYKIKILARVNREKLKILLDYSMPLVPAKFISIFQMSLPKLYIAVNLGLSQLGIYSAGYKVAAICQLFYFAFNMSFYPVLYKSIEDGDYKQIRNINLIAITLSAIFIAIFSFSNEMIFGLLISDDFQASKEIVLYISFVFFILMLKDSVDIGVKITKKTKYTSYVYMVSSMFGVLLYLLVEPIELIYIVDIQVTSFIVLYVLTLINSEYLRKIGLNKLVNISILPIMYVVFRINSI